MSVIWHMVNENVQALLEKPRPPISPPRENQQGPGFHHEAQEGKEGG